MMFSCNKRDLMGRNEWLHWFYCGYFTFRIIVFQKHLRTRGRAQKRGNIKNIVVQGLWKVWFVTFRPNAFYWRMMMLHSASQTVPSFPVLCDTALMLHVVSDCPIMIIIYLCHQMCWMAVGIDDFLNMFHEIRIFGTKCTIGWFVSCQGLASCDGFQSAVHRLPGSSHLDGHGCRTRRMQDTHHQQGPRDV